MEAAVRTELCVDLAPLLAAEIAAGNVVVETSRQWPAALNVWLARPFRPSAEPLPAQVVLRDVNDPHYWLAEYRCAEHDHLLACKFGHHAK